MDSTVVCLPCNQIITDKAFIKLKNTWEKRPIRIVHLGDSHVQIGHFSNQMAEIFRQIQTLKGSGITFPYSLTKSVDGSWFKSKSTGVWLGDNILSAKPKLDLGLTGYSVKTVDSTASISFQLKDPNLNFTEIKIWYNSDSLSYLPDLGNNFTLKEIVKSGIGMGYAHFFRKNPVSQFDLSLIKTDPNELEFQLHGVELITSNSEFEYHALGVAGAQFSHLIQHEIRWKEQLKLLNPDLLIFSFGTNEAYNGNFDPITFSKNVSRFFEEIRALIPTIAILVTSPPDTRSRNRIPQKQLEVLDAQSLLNSSYYDLNAVMGGFGSFQPWYDNNYFLKDKLHLNKAGYQLQAKLFMLALLEKLKPEWNSEALKDDVEQSIKFIQNEITSIDSSNIDSKISLKKKKTKRKNTFHRVQKGDTFTSIAAQYQIPLNTLLKRNHRFKSSVLKIGEKIRVPSF